MKVQTSMRLEIELKKDAQILADQMGIDFTKLVELLLRQAVKERGELLASLREHPARMSDAELMIKTRQLNGEAHARWWREQKNVIGRKLH
ncbi:MAG: hypothetical protein JWN38_1259 [Candidatus Saccharibacteria bacterium]|nr:hypothetical protein [Candidatus Saccharibacteria bacterium]